MEDHITFGTAKNELMDESASGNSKFEARNSKQVQNQKFKPDKQIPQPSGSYRINPPHGSRRDFAPEFFEMPATPDQQLNTAK